MQAEVVRRISSNFATGLRVEAARDRGMIESECVQQLVGDDFPEIDSILAEELVRVRGRARREGKVGLVERGIRLDDLARREVIEEARVGDRSKSRVVLLEEVDAVVSVLLESV